MFEVDRIAELEDEADQLRQQLADTEAQQADLRNQLGNECMRSDVWRERFESILAPAFDGVKYTIISLIRDNRFTPEQRFDQVRELFVRGSRDAEQQKGDK